MNREPHDGAAEGASEEETPRELRERSEQREQREKGERSEEGEPREQREPRERGATTSRTPVLTLLSVLDQGAASAANILVLLLAARTLSAAGFAAFSLVYVTFTVLLGLNTAYVGQVLVLERGGGRALAVACRSAVVFTACASAAAAALLAAGGLLTGGRTGGAFTALGLVLPVALVQDGLRYAFSALRRPGRALAADTLRLLCVAPALLLRPGGPGGGATAGGADGTSPARTVAVWGLSALPALLLGLALLRPLTAGAAVSLRRYVRRGHLGRRFVVEFGVGNASSQLAVLGLGLFAAPLAVGALRGASALFGPLNTLFTSVSAFGPPILGRLGTRRAAVRAAGGLGGALAVCGLGWAGVLTVLPDTTGRQLLGDTWAATSAVLAATGSQYAVMGFGTCALVTLRVLAPRATLALQVVFSLLSVALLLTGYATAGVAGAAWGLAAGSALKACAAWLRVKRAVRGDGTAGTGRGSSEEEAKVSPAPRTGPDAAS